MNKLKKSTKKVSAVLLAGALLVPGGIFAEGQVKNDYSTHWAKATIQKWVDEGLIKGVAGKGVLPNTSVKRAEFVRMANMRYAYSIPAEANKFTDVKAKDWFYRDILIAQKENYIAGITATMFGPNQTVTREQAATIVARIAKVENDVAGVSVFKDANKIAEYAKGSIGGAVKKGLLSGYEDNTFRPKNPLTRAEAIVILDKAYQTGKPDLITPDPEGEKPEDKKPEDKKPDTEVSSERPIYGGGGGGGGSYYPYYPSTPPSKEESISNMAKKAFEGKSKLNFAYQTGKKNGSITIELDKSVAENINKNLDKIAGTETLAQDKINTNVSKSSKIFYDDNGTKKHYLTEERFDNKILPLLKELGFGDLKSKLTFTGGMLSSVDPKLVDHLSKEFTKLENAEKLASTNVNELEELVAELEEPWHSPDGTPGNATKKIDYTITLIVNGREIVVKPGDISARKELVRELYRLSQKMVQPVREALSESYDITLRLEASSEHVTPGNPNVFKPQERRLVIAPTVDLEIPNLDSVSTDYDAVALGIPGVQTVEDAKVLNNVKDKLINNGLTTKAALESGVSKVDLSKLEKIKGMFTQQEMELLSKIVK